MSHVQSRESLAALLTDAPWRRIAVVGDSIAEGLREPTEGFRDLSWVDRIAEALTLAGAPVELRNLGRRHLVAAEVREQQLEAALAFEPDLAIVAAGGNDAFRPGFTREAVERDLISIVAPLRDAGADVLMTELLDPIPSGLFPPELDEPMRVLVEATRAVAEQTGAMLVPMRSHPACADPTVFSSDRVHLNTRGHAVVGTEAVKVLAASRVLSAARRGGA